jgi:peroxiredoxin
MLKMEENLKKQKEPDIAKKKPNIKIVIGLITILTIGITYFYLSSQKTSTNAHTNRDFIFKSIRNKEFHIKSYKNHIEIAQLKGKIVFLKVFGWNCKYCQKEIPELIKLKNKFKLSFDTLAIESQHHSTSENLHFIKKYHINYNILDGDKQKEFLEYLKDEYNWNGVIPLTIVIDGNGKILAFEAGYKSYSLTTLLQTTLKELTTVAVETKKGEN